jgi:hypothetical protein
MKAGWSRKFDEPIPLPKGRQLVTLKDAGAYITKLPKAEEIARLMNRSPAAVYKMAIRLGVPLRPVELGLKPKGK